MNVGSLFSGIGGIDLGLERAGHTVVFQCESDPWRRSVLAARFPGVPCYDDVRRVGGVPNAVGVGATPSPRRGCPPTAAGWREGAARPLAAEHVDLLCGGFPCQDLSVAGRRAGLMHEGGRSNLFFEFARIADELVPSGGHVLIENVPGLLSSNNGRDFAVLLATLAELGFHDLAWRIVDSRYFGVPQRRRRVFILGRRARGDGCAQVLLEPESGGGDFTQGGQAGPGAAGASAVSSLQSGGGERGYQVDAEGAAGGQLIAALTTRAGNTQDDQQSQQLVVAAPLTRGSASGEGVNAPGRRQEDDVNLVVADTVRSHPRPGSIIPILIDAEFSNQEEPKFNETGPLTRKLRKATTDGNAVRRLTPRECERLQGFPDNWTRLDDKTPDSRRYAALGDAVTVNVAEWIGRRLA